VVPRNRLVADQPDETYILSMRNSAKRGTDHTGGAMSRLSGSVRRIRVLIAILCVALSPHLVQAIVLPPASYGVAIAWNGRPGTEVAGYRVYYGVATGEYTNSVMVGNVTSSTVTGLASGVTYFFAITAIGVTGLESDFSSEVSYVPGIPTIRVSVMPAGQVVLKVSGLINHLYDIEATRDFITWRTIGTVTLGASGSLDFADTNAVYFAKRFYRTRTTLP
jgi:hypothetical protein